MTLVCQGGMKELVSRVETYYWFGSFEVGDVMRKSHSGFTAHTIRCLNGTFAKQLRSKRTL